MANDGYGGSVGYEDDDLFDDLGEDELIEGLDEIIDGDDDADEDDDDDLLSELVSGGAPEEIVGRGRGTRGRRTRRSRQVRALKRRILSRNAGLVRPVRRTKKRRLILPIPRTVVAPGDTVDIEIQPQDLFKTTRMLISSAIAFDFSIIDVKIGQKPQFVQSGSMPANCFSEVSVGSYVEFDSADVGNLIVIVVRNNTLTDSIFEGMLLGTAAKS